MATTVVIITKGREGQRSFNTPDFSVVPIKIRNRTSELPKNIWNPTVVVPKTIRGPTNVVILNSGPNLDTTQKHVHAHIHHYKNFIMQSSTHSVSNMNLLT